MSKKKTPAPYEVGEHKREYQKNRKIVMATQHVCYLCGKPIDPQYKWPHPLAGVCDHILAVSKGGSPSALENLAHVHNACNRAKWDNVLTPTGETDAQKGFISNRILPQSIDWLSYSGHWSKESDQNDKK